MLHLFEEELEKIQQKIKPPSVAILGRSGSGKSSLINAVFGVNTAETGAGLPITRSYRKYPEKEDKKIPIILYDSPGFEANKTDEYLKETIDFIQKRNVQNNIDEQIHLVWYTIHASLARIEPFDIEVIRTVYNLGIPLIIVLTQVDIARDEVLEKLKNTIDEHVFPELISETNLENREELVGKIRSDIKILNVAADPLPGNKQKGIEKLVDESINLIPIVYRNAFIFAQRVNIKTKRKVAWTYIGGLALYTYFFAYIPIAGTTAIAVGISQGSLLKILAHLYDAEEYLVPLIKTTKLTLATGLSITATIAVETAANSLGAMFAPLFIVTERYVGFLAASYIVILGLATTATLEHLVETFYDTETNKKEVEEYIKKTFEENFKKYSSIRVNSEKSIKAYGDDFINGKI